MFWTGRDDCYIRASVAIEGRQSRERYTFPTEAYTARWFPKIWRFIHRIAHVIGSFSHRSHLPGSLSLVSPEVCAMSFRLFWPFAAKDFTGPTGWTDRRNGHQPNNRTEDQEIEEGESSKAGSKAIIEVPPSNLQGLSRSTLNDC